MRSVLQKLRDDKKRWALPAVALIAAASVGIGEAGAAEDQDPLIYGEAPPFAYAGIGQYTTQQISNYVHDQVIQNEEQQDQYENNVEKGVEGLYNGIDQGNSSCNTNGSGYDCLVMPSQTLLSVVQPDRHKFDGSAVAVKGDFALPSNGVLILVTDFERRLSDRLNIAGDARLDGRVLVLATSLAPTEPISILNVDGDIDGTLQALDTPAVDFSVRRSRGTFQTVVDDTHFESAYDHLDRNERAVGLQLDHSYEDGAENGFADLLGQVNALSMLTDNGRRYARGLSSLSLGSTQAVAATQFRQIGSRLDSAVGCNASYSLLVSADRANCLWGGVGGGNLRQDGIGAFHGDTQSASVGGEVRAAGDWRLGFAAGIDNTDLDSHDGLSNADGTSGYLGLGLSRDLGEWTFSFGATGSYGEYDTERHIRIPLFNSKASGTIDVSAAGARIGVAYTASLGTAYVKPKLDLDVLHVHTSRYTEKGADLLNLNVDSESKTNLVASPALELGADLPLDGSWALAVSGELGADFASVDEWRNHASFTNAVSSQGFSTRVAMPDTLLTYRAGVTLSNGQGFEGRMEFQGVTGDGYESNAGFLRLIKSL